MTEAEFDALPEDGTIGYTEEMRDGHLVRIPKFHSVGVLWQPEDEPMMVRDRTGARWILGWAGGVRYKRRLRDD